MKIKFLSKLVQLDRTEALLKNYLIDSNAVGCKYGIVADG